ncbi:MAG TPA: hypothetical protein PKY50_18000 [Candidatus Competibacter sp.]|nr:hypothetical protein [Candidatus Competibacter sp.]
MYLNQIPIKTIKGLQEIENRTFQVPAELRRILIMVDSHSTVAQLIKKLVGFGEIEMLLTQLEVGGFIAPRPDSAPTTENSRRPDAVSSDHHPEFNLAKAKGFARHILLGAMGPTAERRINRVEATTTPEELRVELDAIHDMLPKVLSKRQAEQAWRQLEPIMVSLNSPPP